MDIKRLLSKRGWTGEETGKALTLDLINSYKQTLAGNSNPKPLFPPEKITEMLHGFKASRIDIDFYNRYVNLQNWIKQYQAVANAYLQRFNSSMNEFISVHNAAESAENEYRYIEQLPRIMTQKQYEELKARRVEETINPDGKDGIGDSLFYLILRTVDYYAQQMEETPRKANPLKAIKKAYLKQPVKNRAYILAFNEIEGNGYLSLPDGTRSDKVDTEEWQKLLLKFNPAMRRLEEEAEQGLTNEPGSLSFERIVKEARAAHTGEATEEQEDSPTVWHICEEAPEGLNKWDMIESQRDSGLFFECIPALHGEATGEAFTDQAKAFIEEFPELVKTILKELDAMGYTYGSEEKPLSSIPVEEWEETVFSWRELYSSSFPGFREWVEDDANIFEGDKRALFNGIAIIRPSTLLSNTHKGGASTAIDKNGYYKEPEGKSLFSNLFGLDAYMMENPECGDNITHIENTRAALIESLRFLIGYDAALEIIAEEIEIPDFTLFSANSERCIERTNALNGLFDMLYKHIDDIDYRDTKRKAEKLQALRDVFYPIETEKLTISEKTRAEAARMLKDLNAFSDNKSGNSPGWNFLAILTMTEGGGDE